MRIRLVLCAGLVLIASGRSLAAQIITGPPMTAAECQQAATALTGGSRNPGQWGRLAECGQVGATAVSGALSNARVETDSMYLRGLYRVAARLRSGDVWNAALAVGADPTASVPARLVALYVTAAQYEFAVRPPMWSWTQLVTRPMGSYCRFTSDTHGEYGSELAMPADYIATTATQVESVARDATTPPVIRDLARCFRELLTQDVPAATADPAQITLAYVCGNKFRISNASATWVDVTAAVVGTSETADLSVGPNSTKDYTTVRLGTLRLFYNSVAIREATNDAIACPP